MAQRWLSHLDPHSTDVRRPSFRWRPLSAKCLLYRPFPIQPLVSQADPSSRRSRDECRPRLIESPTMEAGHLGEIANVTREVTLEPAESEELHIDPALLKVIILTFGSVR